MRVVVRGLVLFVAITGTLVSGCNCSSDTRPPRDGGGGGLDGGLADTPVPPGVDAPRLVPDVPPMLPDTPDAYLTREEFCMGAGPPVIVGDSSMSTDTCAGAIATRVFDNALCSCEDTNIVGYLVTRSFDSGMGTGDDDYGAPVGVNRNYITGGYADVGGSFVVAGTGGVNFAGYLRIRGDGRFGGDVNAIGRIDVYRDMWVRGNVALTVEANVTRDLHQPTGRTFGFPTSDVGGATIRTAFTVDPPCRCGATEIVDIASIVATGRTLNDNASIGLVAGVIDPVVGIGEEITLPCGRFYLSGISGIGDITLNIPGRTALFIDGDVNALGVFDIDLGPEGELDMFISGNLTSIGAGSYGDRSHPSRTRIYVGGTGDVTIIGATGFVGNVYAPRARITAPGATTVYGSLFGRQIDMPGYLNVHYDRAILDVDVECPPPTGGCEMCGVPGCTDHTACVAGECRGCTSDAECCAPLVCYPDGTCDSLLI